MKNHVYISQFCLRLCFSVLTILIFGLNTSIVSAQLEPSSSLYRNILTPEETLSAYVELGDVQGVRRALDAGADPKGSENFLERRNCFGLFKVTPLHCASYTGDIEVTRILLEVGADVNADAAECGSPLQAAIYYDHPEIFDMLINTDNFNIDNGCSTHTYLYFAMEVRNGRAIKALIDKGANVDALSNEEYTLMASILAMSEQFDSEPVSEFRPTLTPEQTLNTYIELGDVQGVRNALNAGADPNGPEDFSKKRDCFDLSRVTPLHCAAYTGNTEIAHILIAAGADVNTIAAECASPIQATISYNYPEIFNMIFNNDNFNIDNDCSITYLYGAIESRNGGAIKALIDKGANVDALSGEDHAKMVNLIRSYETAFHPIAR